MTTLTQPLRDEHKELYPEVELLRTAGDAIQEALTSADEAKIDQAYMFLTHHLLPHAQAEEAALYPVVGKAMGAPEATATMRRDHQEVQRLTEQLDALRTRTGGTITGGDAASLRCVLYGLYTLVKVHFAKEEEVYLPLLDAVLTPEQAHAMFEAMEEAARNAKSAIA
ncbi:MAG: hemerythrin domain-containing protein [Anaerolineae bacterium]